MQSVVSLLNRSLAVLYPSDEKKRSFLIVQVETLMRRITSSSTCFIHDPSSRFNAVSTFVRLKKLRVVLDNKLYRIHNIDMSKDCDLPYLLTLRAQSWSLLLTLSDSLANVVFGERL